jgi:two-component system LytT family response regulator
MLLRAIIIDDEPKNIRLIKAMLVELLPSVQIVGDASNIEDGVMMTRSLKPHLVFLDIRMSNNDEGFRFFNYFNQPLDFEVIFVTAYEEFIRRAFNNTPAIGYLLKPIDSTELTQVIFKAKQKILNQIFKSNNADNMSLFNEVMYCYIQEGLIKMKLVDNKDKISSKTKLEDFESIPNFFRISRQCIVNLNFIKKIIDIDENGEKTRGAIALLFNEEKLNVSFNRKPTFVKMYEKLTFSY